MNLLGPNSIEYRVKHWWNNHIEIGQKNMDVAGNISAEPMCHKREEGWGIKGQTYAYMGATGAERLESDLTGGEMENSMKNLNIGDSNGHYVKSHRDLGEQWSPEHI